MTSLPNGEAGDPLVPPPVTFVEGTPAQIYLRGGLNLGNTFVPYFATSMSVRDATTYIDLPSDLPVSDEVPISVDELFQRELDEDRVRDEIVNYLERRNDLHFFNSLTVVIFPLADRDGLKTVADDYGNDPSITPARQQAGFERIEIGPVLLLQQHGNSDSGLISWNDDYARAIVLDGQHRLFAMKDVLNTPSQTATELRGSKVPILFLVLDERAGFKEADDAGGKGLFGISRQIFTDLNQKAVSVPKVRLLLLSDEDLVATSLRQILAGEVRIGEGRSVQRRVDEDGRLPLALVDWRSESARFDNSDYLTSMLALRPVVEEVLSLKLPPMGADPSDVRRFLTRATQRLDLAAAENVDLEEVEARLQDCEENEVPFEFTISEVRGMAIQFRELYGHRIVRPLVELRPYRRLVQAYEESGLLTSPREAWLSYDVYSRTTLNADLQSRGLRLPEPILNEVRPNVKNGSLAFQVVFQQASLYVINSLLDFREAVAAEWGVQPDTEAGFLDEIVKRWNIVFPGGLRSKDRTSPFFGAGIRADGTVDYRKSRVSSITGFMAYGLLSPLEWYTTQQPAPSDVGDWVSECWKEIRIGRKADAMKALLSSHGSAWRRSVNELLTAQGKDPDDELLSVGHARDQLVRLAEHARGDS